ncbi:MAG: hypothetical protein KBT10_07510 [Bacteroidales bacterium]|nr:hypothetical protein [Candidatus Sodaliphilus aphodohippi]
MKKNLLLLAAMICSLAVLTACGDDKDEPQVKNVATCTYSVEFTPDVCDINNGIIIYYKTANNETKKDVLQGNTTTSWNKSVELPIDSKNAIIGLRIEVVDKDVKDLAKDKYDLGIATQISIKTTKGQTWGTGREEKFSTVKASQVKDWCSNYYSKFAKGFIISPNGTVDTYKPNFD